MTKRVLARGGKIRFESKNNKAYLISLYSNIIITFFEVKLSIMYRSAVHFTIIDLSADLSARKLQRRISPRALLFYRTPLLCKTDCKSARRERKFTRRP